MNSTAASEAIGQRSLGDPSLLFPLNPPLLAGCPRTSGEDMQYPLEITYDYSSISATYFSATAVAGSPRWAPLLPPWPTTCRWAKAARRSSRASAWDAGSARRSGLAQGRKPQSDLEPQGPAELLHCQRRPCDWAARGIAVASTGNHGISAAAYATRAGLPCVVITSPDRRSRSFCTF